MSLDVSVNVEWIDGLLIDSEVRVFVVEVLSFCSDACQFLHCLPSDVFDQFPLCNSLLEGVHTVRCISLSTKSHKAAISQEPSMSQYVGMSIHTLQQVHTGAEAHQ